MPFYEIITEPGSHMIAEYADDTEAVNAVKAHHQKAISGEVGGPTGHPAERVVKVLKYEVHPGDYGQEQVVPADVVSSIMSANTNNGLVDINQLFAGLRGQVDALVNDPNKGRHESDFVMQEVESLDPKLWQDSGSANETL